MSEKLVHNLVGVLEGPKFFCSCAEEFNDREVISKHIKYENGPKLSPIEQKLSDIRVALIRKTLAEFDSPKLADILKQFKLEGITLMSDKMEGVVGYYNPSYKLVTVNRDFMNKIDVDDELAYALLRLYYQTKENKRVQTPMNSEFREAADLYAKAVFRNHGMLPPKMFRQKDD